MARDVGVVRNADGLRASLALIDKLSSEHGRALPLVAARLVTAAALERRESRGGHYRSDFPNTDASARRTFIEPAQGAVVSIAAA
jgi:L-aspartate oxidase